MTTGPLLGQLKAMAPAQCGVGIPGACESIGQGLQDTISALPPMGDGADWVVVQVDVANAFNTLGRQAVLRNAATSAPAMYPWLRFLYEEPAQLFCQGDLLWSRTGVHQGCPLGPAAFDIGVHPTALAMQGSA